MRKNAIYGSLLFVSAIIIAISSSTSGCGGDNSATTTGDASAGDGNAADSAACMTGSTSCAGQCSDTSKDPTNCGSCGNACKMGEVCSVGVCSLYCGGGTTKCGALCVDEKNDANNCGACGMACASGQVCSQGACALSCGGGTTKCGTSCVDEKADPTNCGGCGTKCTPGQACSNGSCSLNCQMGLLSCGGDAGADAAASYCANGQTDDANCGACGNVCISGTQCHAGQCTLTCQMGLTSCPAPVMTSDAGVGDASVSDAADAATGDAGPTAMVCANLLTDNTNCGTCGRTCAGGQSCSNGSCTSSCAPPQTLCTPDGGTPYCATTTTDSANCGSCGNACGSNQTCIASTCVANVLGTIAPQPVNGVLANCTVAQSFAGRKAAVSTTNDIVVGMICGVGAAAQAQIVVSTNGGVTYGAPVAIAGMANVNDLALAAGPARIIYATSITNANSIQFSRSTDGGATWSAAVPIGTLSNVGFGTSLAVYGDNVYVANRLSAGNFNILRNNARGVGAFATTAGLVVGGVSPNDILTDARNGDVWVVGDAPGLHVRRSSDGAVTFAAEAVPAPPYNGGLYTDWTLANGNLYVLSGGPDGLFAIPTAAPTTSTSIPGVTVAANTQLHAIGSDAAGNVYAASATGAGAVILQRVVAGATVIASSRTLAPSGGTQVIVAGGPANTAVVAYLAGAQVFATVQTY